MISFDPNLPADHSALSSAEVRNQLNALKSLFDGLQQQLAPLIPVLNRSAAGQWTLTNAGPKHDYWQIWSRSSNNPAWSDTGEMQTSDFPAQDSEMVPDGASWWQVKICGEDSDGKPATPFSNIISFGPVQA